MEKRATFTGSLGFILSAAGSAVGLGNIWRFPYLTAKYGGGMFLLIYIILVLTFGYTLMVAENAIGRKTGKSALSAFGTLKKNWSFLGIIATIIPCIIVPYYNVIGGWVVRYLLAFIMGKHQLLAGDTYFPNMLSSASTLVLFQFIFSLITTLIVLLGVEKGIENFSKIFMPILILLAIVISVYSISLPGAKEGLKYLFLPNFSNLSIQGFVAAMGQMFYSLSLAMGIMIAYGSYLPKSSDLEGSVKKIEIFDTGISILACTMIIPAVFAFSNGDKSALNQGAGLMFVTLPKVFEKMGLSTVIGITFFALVFFAALTSSMSIMEAIVSSIADKCKLKRKTITILVGIGGFLVGILPALGYNVLSGFTPLGFDILDLMDFVSNNLLMPICAFLTCIFVAYVIGIQVIDDEITSSGPFKRKKLFTVMIRYIAPILLIVILASSILQGFGILTL